MSNTLGVAGFPSAEAYKVGKKHPYFRLQRAFFRQTVDLGGATAFLPGSQVDIRPVRDVGPRDGLQACKSIMSTDAKLAWIDAMVAAGVFDQGRDHERLVLHEA